MTPTQGVLLSPYHLAADQQTYLDEREMVEFMHGYLALWHPAALRDAEDLPAVAPSYDHEEPAAGHLYAVPAEPPLVVGPDWPDRVTQSGAAQFAVAEGRAGTIANLREALGGRPEFDWPDDRVRPFYGLGLGYLVLLALGEANYHDEYWEPEEFWADVRAALDDESGDALRSAAEKLAEARREAGGGDVYLIDLVAPAESPDLPATADAGLPFNVVADGLTLKRLAAERPEWAERLKAHAAAGEEFPRVDVCGGVYAERADAALPPASQLWNLRRGQQVLADLFGQPARTFARLRAANHARLPGLLGLAGLRQMLLASFDDAVLPPHAYYASSMTWAADGREVHAFTRTPLPAESVETYFNLAFHVHETSGPDASSAIALLHRGQEPPEFYHDLVALGRLGPAVGEWVSLSRFLSDTDAGEHAADVTADDFFNDDLQRAWEQKRPDPVSGIANHARRRHDLDAAFSLATLSRMLGGATPDLARLTELEESVELGEPADVDSALNGAARNLAERLQRRSPENQPGLLVLNPCGFGRRVALEVPDFGGPVPVAAPLKAAQFDADAARLVVEVPAFGFAWVPRGGDAAPPTPRIKLADEFVVRNEYFEAEVDAETGGLRAFRDPRTRTNRLGQRLTPAAGGGMRATKVSVTQDGAALGEVTAVGVVLDEAGDEVAAFRQRFRAWLGRPVLEVAVELTPTRPVENYPWQNYLGCRFAWRDETAQLSRGVCGAALPTAHDHLVSPEFLEVRTGNAATAILTGGLPFLRRVGSRMLDLVLIPEYETATSFEFGLAADRDNLAAMAAGFSSPVVCLETAKGPPPVGPAGWLAHVGAPNLLAGPLRPDPDGGVLLTLNETAGVAGSCVAAFARPPSRAALVEGDAAVLDLPVADGAVPLDFAAHQMMQLRAEFSP